MGTKELSELLDEGRVIQKWIPTYRPPNNNEQVARSFAKLMFQGKTQAALQLLSDRDKGGILHLHDSVGDNTSIKDVLKSTHLQSNPVHPELFNPGVPPDVQRHLMLL